MDGPLLRDEAVKDRIRQAAEFLDPSMFVDPRDWTLADCCR